METEILQHRISYHLENDKDIDESDEQHIESMIIDGYNSGELNSGEDETRGWWKIVK